MPRTPAVELERLLTTIELQKGFLRRSNLSSDRRRVAERHLAELLTQQDGLMRKLERPLTLQAAKP